MMNEFSYLDRAMTYDEFRIRLSLMGYDSFPNEPLFTAAASADFRWARFLSAINFYARIGRPFEKMTMVSAGLI